MKHVGTFLKITCFWQKYTYAGNLSPPGNKLILFSPSNPSRNAVHKNSRLFFLCLSDTYSNCWVLTPTPTDEQPARF